ncbi:MAG TPA: hypothetical protein PK605_01110 [Ignavibacteria bacterium]|nr:hypothetical protein [Bacteroidota bacterium]HRE09749.1 hypothetical protein [Ignavibacteria bacterium]HRF65524.1 hypothetical protein [Ignavibacteria bacterium]HRJ02980.1 hypothetical protein [Ignavibacteria bacterium]HRJ84217.1 hypothetical protein [Ignavibacteria bacterium]
MKTLQKLTAIFILLAAITSLHADEKIKIKLHQPPPNQMGVGDLWNLELTNTTNAEMKIYLTGTATEEKDGLIIESKTKVFTLKPGRSNYKYNDFSGAEVKYNNGKYKEIILRTGNAPEGSYTICVTAFDDSGTEVGRENCIMQSVQQLGGITLLTPGDGEELDPDTLPGLMFTWTPLPKGGPYSLRIVELKGSESKEEGIRANRPIIEKEKISISSYQLGSTDPKLEAGKRYAWQVTSGDVESEVGRFRIDKIRNVTTLGKEKFTIEIVSPTTEKFMPNSRPEFKWRTKNDKNIDSYTLLIAKIDDKEDKINFDSLSIVAEFSGIKEKEFKYPKDQKLLDEYRNYAWIVFGIDNEKKLAASSLPGLLMFASVCSRFDNFCFTWTQFSNSLFCIPFCTNFEICQGENMNDNNENIINWWIPIISCGTGTVYSWTINSTGQTQSGPPDTDMLPPGVHSFTYNASSPGGSISVPITVTIPQSPVQICSPIGNITECCGIKTFRLRSAANCNIDATFPSNTKYHWFIMKSNAEPTGNLPNLNSYETSYNLPLDPTKVYRYPLSVYSCNNQPVVPLASNVWYKFGGLNSNAFNADPMIGGLVNQIFPHQNSSNSELRANDPNNLNEKYYVTCFVETPETEYIKVPQSCLGIDEYDLSVCSGGFANGFYSFRVNQDQSPLVISNATWSTTSATCVNTTGGSITLNESSISGGTPPYSYRLGNSGEFQQTSTFTDLVGPYNYSIQVRDANGCTKIITPISVGFTGSGNVPVPTITPNSGNICIGGFITLTANTTGGPWSYEWFSGNTPVSNSNSQMFQATSGGSYQVRIFNNTGDCNMSLPVSLVQSAWGLTLNINGSNTYCNGGNTTLQAIPSYIPSSGVTTYNWFNSSNTQVGTGQYFTVFNPGTYFARIENVDGEGVCRQTSSNFMVDQTNCPCTGCDISIVNNPPAIVAIGQYQYQVTLDINNNSGCAGDFNLSFAIPSQGTFVDVTNLQNINPGSNSRVFTFFTLAGSGTQIAFFGNTFTNVSGVNCSENFKVPIP